MTMSGPAAPSDLLDEYLRIRATTERLASVLSAEDQTVQTMPDVSPTKWHRAHVTWFFETFVLGEYAQGYHAFDDAYAYIFNSYYEAMGARHPRPERGLLSRPGIDEIARYRAYVDGQIDALLRDIDQPGLVDLITLGLHHEQQHQELLLMDIKHVLSRNPLHPVYLPATLPRAEGHPPKAGWLEHDGGPVEIGHRGVGFGFDNEYPVHTVHLTPFGLADRPVTCGDWLSFMEDDGYRRPEFWLSDGWAVVNAQDWDAPLYWSRDPDNPDQWLQFTLSGLRPVDPDEPVCHVSYYEADAFAHWTGMRLPTESEWEIVAAIDGEGDNFLRDDFLGRGAPHPLPAVTTNGLYGDTWEWTSSSYSPYPGFRAAPGAVGEYNGKFMVSQYVLRGGCCATPQGHTRSTYRNFFPPGARWPFGGVRLARDP
ncbi:MAG TPA: ergothioneine biosynthesis protein EgtB [Acidimicrobiales bacterium]|nr:ergothioneine biosynthesis protein EgtB [Acidimicrobiales bacterium]